MAFAQSSCPSGWLATDGAAVSRTTYASLFTAISTAYGVGDGATTFNLPDHRGYFLRGSDNGSGNDPDAASRTDRGDGTTGDNVGTKQAGAFVNPTINVTLQATTSKANAQIPAAGYYLARHLMLLEALPVFTILTPVVRKSISEEFPLQLLAEGAKTALKTSVCFTA